jgi:hypothetical protein
VYVLAGSPAERLLPTLAADAERAIAANLAWLGEPAARVKLRLFFVGSREQMRPLTGANDSVRPALRHELMHLLSWRLWGTPGGVWLSEGVASVAAGSCRGWSFDDVAAALDRAGRLVAFDELRQRFIFAGEAGAARYLQSASVVAYIERVHGRRRLRAFWSTGGFGGSEHSLGVGAAVLEARWRADVARRRTPASWAAMWRVIHAHGCE